MLNITIIIFSLIILPFLFRIFYYVLTLKEEQINILKKIKITRVNNIIYEFYTINKKYIIQNDIIISKNKCKELWNSIEENKTYKIKYYGSNIPLLNIYYHVISITEI